MAFINAFDPKWSGALPATFIYDSDGKLRHALYGKTRTISSRPRCST